MNRQVGVNRLAVADEDVGEALLDASAAWSTWCLRRVDSIHPDVGERGRVRHSMDCIPPPDTRLAYEPRERRHRRFGRVRGHVIVPLVLVAKGPMRELDAADSDGRSMPLLGVKENVSLAVAMMESALRRQGVQPTDELHEVLRVVAGPVAVTGPSPLNIARVLVATGEWDGIRHWSPDLQIDQDVKALVCEFAETFLLCGLLPAEDVGRRQVLKLAFHWRVIHVDPQDSRRAVRSRLTKSFRRLGVGLRLFGRELELPMNAPSDTQSYHLEFQTPAELDCSELTLPAAVDAKYTAGMADGTRQPVAHAHGHYEVPPGAPARAVLTTPARGLWTHTLLASLVTAAFFVAGRVLPGGMDALQESRAADALLLAVAAVVIGLAAGRRESALAAWALGPLRFVMFAHSAVLSIWAAAIAGRLQDPWFTTSWTVCMVGSSLWLVVMLTLPAISRLTADDAPALS